MPYETIKCPECGKVQQAEVVITTAWNSYCHECINCGYWISESEWDEVDGDD